MTSNVQTLEEGARVSGIDRKSIEDKIETRFQKLNEIFGIAFYQVISFHVSQTTGHDLPRSCIEAPRTTLDSLRTFFGADAVNDLILPHVLDCNQDSKRKRDELIKFMEDDYKKCVMELFKGL